MFILSYLGALIFLVFSTFIKLQNSLYAVMKHKLKTIITWYFSYRFFNNKFGHCYHFYTSHKFSKVSCVNRIWLTLNMSICHNKSFWMAIYRKCFSLFLWILTVIDTSWNFSSFLFETSSRTSSNKLWDKLLKIASVCL